MSSPDSSEGARFDTGRPTTATNTATARQKVLGHRTARIWHVVPDAHTVVGRSGNTRLILRVPQCPWCGKAHLHQGGQGQAEPARRRAACGLGCYVLEMRGAVA